ncbi:RNA polymerase sigma factor, partial [Plastoroseomonas arctica]
GRDLAAAEDALADAFAAALATWPATGTPQNPEAWLLTTARRRLTDAARRRATATAAEPDLEHLASIPPDAPGDIPDHRLALLLACADPAVEPAARAPLMLQAVLGLDAARIASAFLVPPATMSQRLVRAKRRLKESGARFTLPGPETLAHRLPETLAAIYAGYAAGAQNPEDGGALAGEAAWLARLTAALAPDAAEANGLAALLLHLEARRPAGRDATGAYVPLAEQDPARWNAALQDEAETLLRRAFALNDPGRYQWEAAIASAHAARRHGHPTDWTGIVGIYDALLAATGSPVIAINRAVALAETAGPRTALATLKGIEDARLNEYQPYWAALAALATRAGDDALARSARMRAAGLSGDPAVRAFLLQ